MVISEKRINMGMNIILSIMISIIYLLMHSTGYYDFSLRFMVAIGLIPVASVAILLLQTAEIRIAVITLVLYQTWNMFLEPYTWDLPVKSIYRIFSSDDFPMMALCSTLSIWMLYFGFLYGMHKIKSKSLFTENYLNIRQIEKLLVYMIIGGLVLQLTQMIISALRIPFGFLGLIETMLPSTVGAVAVLYWLRGGRKIIYLILTIVYVAYYFVYYVGGTLFIYSIFLIAVPTVIYIVERKKIPYMTVFTVAILLLPIYLSRHTYRNEGLYSSGTERLLIGWKILETEYANANILHWQELIDKDHQNYNVDNRTEGVTYLATIINRINNGTSQYAYGETIAWLPTMFIPRFLIPFRPSQNMGDKWAIYYGVKDASWRASINFPMLCEFYANFGYLGMIILSFFNGIFIIWMMGKFNNGIGDTNLMLLIFVVTKIIVIEANVTLAYGAILQVITICWLIKRFIPKTV
jgi:hypothetical protein